MAHEDDFEKIPCNNCQGCGCTTCGGSGWLIDQTRPTQKHSSGYPPETLFTHYQIELENINEEWDCTICESLDEVLGVLKYLDIHLDDDTELPDGEKMRVIITGIGMTREAFKNWVEEEYPERKFQSPNAVTEQQPAKKSEQLAKAWPEYFSEGEQQQGLGCKYCNGTKKVIVHTPTTGKQPREENCPVCSPTFVNHILNELIKNFNDLDPNCQVTAREVVDHLTQLQQEDNKVEVEKNKEHEILIEWMGYNQLSKGRIITLPEFADYRSVVYLNDNPPVFSNSDNMKIANIENEMTSKTFNKLFNKWADETGLENQHGGIKCIQLIGDFSGWLKENDKNLEGEHELLIVWANRNVIASGRIVCSATKTTIYIKENFPAVTEHHPDKKSEQLAKAWPEYFSEGEQQQGLPQVSGEAQELRDQIAVIATEMMNNLEIHKWWDYGDFEDIRDKDVVGSDIADAVMELIAGYSTQKAGYTVELKREAESIRRNMEKLNDITWKVYKEQVLSHLDELDFYLNSLPKQQVAGEDKVRNMFINCIEKGCERPAVSDYNGHGHYVCKMHMDSLSREFDNEYK